MAFFDRIRRFAAAPRIRTEDVPPNERPVLSTDGAPGEPFPSVGGDKTAAPGKPASPKHGEPENAQDAPENTGEGTNENGGGHSVPESLYSDFYNRLYSALQSYGVTNIPAFDEMYGLLESFLRPAIDAAIEAREQAGRANMAELDADAYARGMGGSSYLSSVKAREQDAVASDVMALEGKYSAAMGEYLYKALSAMQEMEKAFRLAQMSLSGSHSGGGHAGSSGGSAGAGGASGETEDGRLHSDLGYGPYGHNKDGAYFDGVWYEGDFSYLEKPYTYSDYLKYLNTLSPRELDLFFHSDERQWRIKRWQLQYNLAQVDYLDLVARFGNLIAPGSPGGGTPWSQEAY